MERKKIADRVKKIMEIFKLNKRSLSKKIRVSHSLVTNIINSKIEISRYILLLFKETFNINPEWLLEGKDPMYLPANLDAFSKGTGDLVRSFEKLPEKYQEEVKYLVQELEIRHKREMKKREREREKIRNFLDRKEYSETVQVAFIGEVVRDDQSVVEYQEKKTIEIPKDAINDKAKESFLIIKSIGDAMERCDVGENFFMVFEKKSFALDGEIVLFELNGRDKMIAEIRINPSNQIIELTPCNPKYEIIKINSKKDSIRILGVLSCVMDMFQ